MAILIERQDGESDMRRSGSRSNEIQKTLPQHYFSEKVSFVSKRGCSNSDTSRQGPPMRYFCMSEIARHNTEDSAWIVAGDDVYDVTEYMHRHPAGKAPILRKTGGALDCTADLLFHSKKGRNVWNECLIGKVTTNPSLNGQIVGKPWWIFWV